MIKRALVFLCCFAACGPVDPPAKVLGPNSLEVGASGGELVAPDESPWAGIKLVVPPGALKSRITITLGAKADEETPLPDTAERVGPFLSFEPEGTVLETPAEITVELDPMKVASFDATPADCKVWMRSQEGWQRLDQVSSTPSTVTVKLPKLATLAAGINSAVKGACLQNVATANCTPTALVLTPFVATTPCASITSDYCLMKLPTPESTLGVDEFASLVVKGRFVYWLKKTADGNNDYTIGRYSLDNPGPVVELKPLKRAPVGSVSVRGRLAVANEGNVAASIGGFGNVQFFSSTEPIEKDVVAADSSRGPVGVVTDDNGNLQRFYKINVSGKTDLRMGGLALDKFIFNYNFVPLEDIVGVQRSTPGDVVFRSVHRGAALTYRNPTGADQAAVDFAQGGFGSVLDTDSITYGAAAIDPGGQQISVAKGSTVQRWDDADDFDALSQAPNGTGTLPAVPRDLAMSTFNGTLKTFAIASGRNEIYELSSGGVLRTLPLDEAASSSPWRIAAVPGTADVLVVTRGSLLKKGDFYLLRRLR